MKKALLFASMGLLGLSAAAQGVDPVQYAAKEGYTLKNLWLYAAGNGVDGVAINDWNELTNKMANPGKATMATRLGDYVYISCSQDYKVGEDGATVVDHGGHLLVLDAKTGKFVKDLKLTLDGAPYADLICANCIGVDDFGHLWITPYVSSTYSISEATGEEVIKPVPLYMVNTETGEMTKIYDFALDEIEGPEGGGRVDYCDVSGDITREKARCVFMAIPNELAVVTAWHSEQGSDEWDIDVSEDCEYNVIKCEETYPADQVAWNYSPMVAIVGDDEFSGENFYTDGHTTQPVLYDKSGEMLGNLSGHTPAADATADDDPWVGFMPGLQANGVREFGLGGDRFLAYAVTFPDETNLGGDIAIVKLDENASTENATPLWRAPQGHLGIRKGEGRFSHSINISPVMQDANGKQAVEIMVYKDVNGIGLYLMAQDGYEGQGIADAVADITANGPVKFFNLNGVEVDQNNLTAGVYVTLQGGVAKKVVIK